jgi:peptidyl-prolyl cis-trans isomerase A (cyclophilin A)
MSLRPKAHQLPAVFLGLAAMLTGMSCVKTPSASPPVPTVKGEGPASDSAGETFLVKLETTKGDIVIEVHPSWAPNGAAHFRELVEAGYYTDCAFFRVMPGFMCQAGVAADPEVTARWMDRSIPDDPVIKSNEPGYVTFGNTGRPNSRSTHIFINYGDNRFLDSQLFAPFGKVIEGMDVATSINSQYGERPDQGQMKYQGNAYLRDNFPDLDYILKATVVSGETAGSESASAEGDASNSDADGASQGNQSAAESEAPAAETASESPAAAESN